jgi:hemerythrin-like domain-containing protein
MDTTTNQSPTETLSAEHRVIERGLDCLETLARRARADGALDLRSAAEVLQFLRAFADGCHHHKEEQGLFRALERRGVPSHVGPVAVMLAEHEEGRAAIRAMVAELEASQRGDSDAAARFAGAAEGYVELLRAHIDKEDQVLFPMADAVLREEDRAEVLRQFAAHEAAGVDAGLHERMLALVDALCARLGIDSSRARPARAGACCHGAGGACGG